MFCVYELTNPLKGDKVFYVGKGDPDNRPQKHASQCRSWMKNGRLAGTSLNLEKLKVIAEILKAGLKPGIQIIHQTNNEQEALDREVERIAEIGLENLTNMDAGGSGTTGYTHTEEARCKIGEASKRHWEDPDYRARVTRAIGERSIGNKHWLGRKHTAESREKMSKAQKGRTFSETTRKKMSEAAKRRGPRPVTEETREKLAKASTGRTPSPETRQRMSEAARNRKVSEKTKAEIKAKKQATWAAKKSSGVPKREFSEEHRKKLSEARKRSADKNKG